MKETEKDIADKAELTAGLVIAEEDKAELAAEIIIANIEKTKHAAELVIANAEKAELAAGLVIADLEKEMPADELTCQNAENVKLAAELVAANLKKAKHSAELVFATVEKARRAAELVIANKNTSREAELIKEKEKLVAELTVLNKELIFHINERKLAEEALKNSNIFRESLLKAIPFGMHIVDETGTVLFQSDNFKEVIGESAVGKKCWELYQEDKKQSSDCPLINGINICKTEVYEAHGVHGNRIFEISHTSMMYQGKKAMLEIFHDITERKKKVSELIRAKENAKESDRLKSAFLANMSHEIRTPLNGILGFTELLKEKNLSSDDRQDFIQTIQISSARLLNTINNIVDISKIESGLAKVDLKETSINEKIEFTYGLFKPEAEIKGLKFFYKNGLNAKEAIIKTDNEKVYEILTILVGNAIKFTFEGSIEFGYEKKEQYLEFFVKDTGIGIPQNQYEMIFEQFRQGSESDSRGYDGSGLGLSIAKSYIKMLGGEIWVESKEGNGSIFYFTIPYNVVPEELEIIDVISAENKNGQIKLKVLIVEDDEASGFLLTRTLQKINCEVLNAITGIQAIEVCRKTPDLDLVLMDIKMPRMDGYEATRKIRQFNNDIIIIAQTAYSFSDDREKAILAGCNDYISKPINGKLLVELIKKHSKSFAPLGI